MADNLVSKFTINSQGTDIDVKIKDEDARNLIAQEISDRSELISKDTNGNTNVTSKTGDVAVSGKNITDTATGDVTVSGKNITDTATENYTENAKNKTENYTNHTENVEIDKECTVKNNYIIKNKDRILDVYTLGSITNVKDFGAIGDGITDDYTSFSNAINATKNGDIIIVPYGNYLLSKNPYNVSNNVISTDPDVYTQWRKWIIATGTTFTGAGLGDVETGNGTFNSTFSTNPWLVVSGNNNLYNLNNIACPTNGALIADAKELAPIENYNNETHRWYSLEYRGASTGNELITNSSVELLNQVLNITANKGIATEIDINNYTADNSSGFSTGLFLTGGGAGKADTTAIDILRDRDSTRWVNGISIRDSRNGIYINNVDEAGIKIGDSNRYSHPTILTGKQLKNGGDCISLTRNTDTDPEGNFIICFNGKETDPALFRVDINGNVFSRERNISAAAVPPMRETKQTENQHFTTGEHTINFTAPAGYKIGLVAEVASIGFVSACNVINVSENSFTFYNTNDGTGSIKYTLLFIPA